MHSQSKSRNKLHTFSAELARGPTAICLRACVCVVVGDCIAIILERALPDHYYYNRYYGNQIFKFPVAVICVFKNNIFCSDYSENYVHTSYKQIANKIRVTQTRTMLGTQNPAKENIRSMRNRY